jgi:miniconductance mechanosensitive channel
MDEADGRRIKRSINIDMTSVRFCDDEMLRRLQNIVLLREYLPGKLEEIRQYNLHNGIDSHSPVNGRRLTNLGSFRAYLTAYIHKMPEINSGMTLLVRYLQPDENGLPIEIYGFSHDKTWASYEALQADITDHIIAVLPYFGLRVFQLQAGSGPEPADFFPSAAMPKTAPEKALE